MLVLFDTPAGFAIFKVLDEGKLKDVDNIYKHFNDAASARSVVKLKAFHAFEDTKNAVGAATAIVDGKMGDQLKKFIKKSIVKKSLTAEILGVSDPKIGAGIKKKFDIQCLNDEAVKEVIRGIRGQFANLADGIDQKTVDIKARALSHSLSRYKLKFSPEKVDTMVVQAIGLLDDLDKEINTYAMRVKEWYGWHFPELQKIVVDNLQYAQLCLKMGMRKGVEALDFSDILSEEGQEADVKQAAKISMGTEITEDDLTNIHSLCKQVISLYDYRTQLSNYLQSRMNTIAPNLTYMVGELVGARLIAHAGSLMNLAKQPASTVQILGAEKALFRALKTKSDTPKYGLIYHASLIGKAAPKHKGKISRVLAAKASLACRVDALGESSEVTIGIDARQTVEDRLRSLDNTVTFAVSGGGKKKGLGKHEAGRAGANTSLVGAGVAGYNAASDATAATPKPKKRKAEDLDSGTAAKKEKKEKSAKKEKKAKKDKSAKKKKKKSKE
eukprot:INCI2682.12.p1 GENE.INCI2682.12~~INCI2682.12.p1  ORF type:complete len:499 (+),score=126.54 INCI2682.12:183-1679(+)